MSKIILPSRRRLLLGAASLIAAPAIVRAQIISDEGVFGASGSGGSGATITYQGEAGNASQQNTSTTITAAPIGTAFSNRRVIAVIPTINSYDAPVTAVTIGGISATFVTGHGSGAGTGSFSGAVTWAWTDVPTGTTANVVVTGGTSLGNGSIDIYMYTFDKTLISNSSPTTAYHNAASTTTNTVTLNTNANGFIIVANQCDSLGTSTSPSITASTETYATDSNSLLKETIASKTSGSAANTPTSVTFGWTNTGQSIASILAWN